MEIIYRVYEIEEREEEMWNGTKITVKENVMLDQNICCCNSREHFKEIMREMYEPKKIHFAKSRKLDVADIYVVIISENCYNTSQYFIVNDYKCSHCGKEFKSNVKLLKKFNDNWRLSSICKSLYLQQEEDLKEMVFCCETCRNRKLKNLIEEYEKYVEDNNLVPEKFIGRESFNNDNGYIYIITKKSTNEFYVGQTIYVPIFRWGQHLLTERFQLKNIEDYKFEVLEVVKDVAKLNEREAYWINKKRNENPELSLNIMIPKEKQPNLFDVESE